MLVPLTTAQHYFVGGNSIRIARRERRVGRRHGPRQRPDRIRRCATATTSPPPHSDDFTIQNQAQLLDTVSSVTGTLTLLLAGIASISLIVGGIGIMNIMLVSVRERTREIGIRKAIGARRRDILAQFLVEALALSLLGGADRGRRRHRCLGRDRRRPPAGDSPSIPRPSCSLSASVRPSAWSSGSGRLARPRRSIRSRPCATSSGDPTPRMHPPVPDQRRSST